MNGGGHGTEHVLLDHAYVSSFLNTVEDRVEYIYQQYHHLEQLEFKDPKQASKRPPIAHLIEELNALCRRISTMILQIPPSLLDLQRRAELTQPLLIFIAETLGRLRDPCVRVIERVQEVRTMRTSMERGKTREIISTFLSAIC